MKLEKIEDSEHHKFTISLNDNNGNGDHGRGNSGIDQIGWRLTPEKPSQQNYSKAWQRDKDSYYVHARKCDDSGQPNDHNGKPKCVWRLEPVR